MKRTTIDSVRRNDPNRLHTQTSIFAFVGIKPLRILSALRFRLTQVFKLHATDIAKIVCGAIGIPNIESCLNKDSSPPVVGVVVVARSSRMICKGT